MRIEIRAPKAGGTVSCVLKSGSNPPEELVTYDLVNGESVSTFAKGDIKTLLAPLRESALALGNTVEVSVTYTNSEAVYTSDRETEPAIPLEAASAARRDLELRPVRQSTSGGYAVQWSEPDGTTPPTKIFYSTDSATVENWASRQSAGGDGGTTVDVLGEPPVNGLRTMTVTGLPSGYWLAVRDLLGRRSEVVRWVPPRESTVSLSAATSQFQFAIEPSLDQQPLVQPEGATSGISVLDSDLEVSLPGNGDGPNRRFVLWALGEADLTPQLVQQLVSGPQDRRVLQRRSDPRTSVPNPSTSFMDWLLLTSTEAQRISASAPSVRFSLGQLEFSDCAAGDFDGNGTQDLLMLGGSATGSPKALAVSDYWAAQAASQPFNTADASPGILAGDLEGTGKDLVITSSGSVAGIADLDTNPSFVAISPQPYPLGTGAIIGWRTAALVDLDSDGDLDVIALRVDSDRVQLVGLRHSMSPTGTAQFRTLLDAQAGGSAGQIVVVDLDDDGAREIVWQRANGDIHMLQGRRTASSGRETWTDLFESTNPVFTAPPAIAAQPGRRTPMAVGDIDRNGLPDLARVNANGTTLEVIKASTDLPSRAGRAELLGSTTLDKATNPAWLGDHLVVVQRVDASANRLVFLDPWDTSPPNPPAIPFTDQVDEIAAGGRAGVGSILARTITGRVGTISGSGAATFTTQSVAATHLFGSPTLDRNRVVDLLWRTPSGVEGSTDGGTSSIALALTQCAVGDIDGDQVTDILHVTGSSLSVSRLATPASWSTVQILGGATDVRALAILPPRGLLARLLVARVAGPTTTIQKYSTNLVDVNPSLVTLGTATTDSSEVKGLLTIPEAGREQVLLHTTSGLFALDHATSTAIQVLPGSFDGFEFASLGGDAGMDLVSWRKEGTKTVIEYWLLPRTN